MEPLHKESRLRRRQVGVDTPTMEATYRRDVMWIVVFVSVGLFILEEASQPFNEAMVQANVSIRAVQKNLVKVFVSAFRKPDPPTLHRTPESATGTIGLNG